MNGVTNYFPLNYIINITIFCDTTPLASYLVEYFNMNKADTIGLQHGFYPVATNNYWKKIYRASNTKYFLAWDDVTIEQMSKYSKTRIRTFIPAGPINITDKKTSNTEKKSKGKLEKIAIYGAGIDQQEINNYLIKLINYFKRYSNIEVIFICHPSYNLFSRIFFSIKKTVKHSSNKEKNKPYDLHVVLNSSVWLELVQKGEPYIRIDDLYNNKENMKNVFLKIMKSKNENLIITPKNLRIPFLNSKDSLETIRSLILKGKTNVL